MNIDKITNKVTHLERIGIAAGFVLIGYITPDHIVSMDEIVNMKNQMSDWYYAYCDDDDHHGYVFKVALVHWPKGGKATAWAVR